MPLKDPIARRAYTLEYRRRLRERDPDYAKRMYQKHRAKRLAAKKAEYAALGEVIRERNRTQYARHRAKRVLAAREYRQINKYDVNGRAMARYYANRDEINERRKGYRKKHYAKIYARIQKWRKENPEREFLYHAKRLLAEQAGMSFSDVPDDLAEAKVEQLKIHRWVKGNNNG